MYNGQTDHVEHVSHFNQRMDVYSNNEVLMCKVFPSSLGTIAMRWFDGLGSRSINSFKELIRPFGSRFITCSRIPWLLDSLLSLAMREGETLKTYTYRYWEMFNEIDGNFEDVAIRTFKVSLLAKHGLRKSLTGKPVSSVHQFMDRIDKYKRVEEDQQLGKGKAKVVSQDMRDFRLDKYTDNRHRRDFTRQIEAGIMPQAVNMEGRLQQFLYRPVRQISHIRSGTQGNTSSRPLLGTINVIFATPGRADSCPSRIITVARPLSDNFNHGPKRAKVALQLVLSFSDKDKFETIKPHDDALVVTLRIGGFDGKMVIPIGQVKLPVQTGSEVVEVNFIVVDAYSPYMVIVARP
ncbi:uncharacterized protein LOC142611927 [Castanea sativa]|uniref:uncharacterized protein LOC142611927 n=1 Tax=Castanea sativa TaxID=21020 RepID=UPI003F649CA3